MVAQGISRAYRSFEEMASAESQRPMASRWSRSLRRTTAPFGREEVSNLHSCDRDKPLTTTIQDAVDLAQTKRTGLVLV